MATRKTPDASGTRRRSRPSTRRGASPAPDPAAANGTPAPAPPASAGQAASTAARRGTAAGGPAATGASTLRWQLPGAVDVDAPRPVDDGDVAIRDHRRIDMATRRGTGQPAVVETAADDVVRVELDDGVVLWMRADDLLRDYGQAVPAAATPRGTARGRRAPAAAPVNATLPASLSPARGAGAQRGALGLAIKALDLMGVDLKGATAAALGRLLETRRLEGQAPGLYRVPLDAAGGAPRFEPVGARLPATDRPVLVFLHGTLSSLNGSFGALWTDAAAECRAQLRAKYGEEVYAFEHRSLSESPIANALALARALPAGATVHLVSHSRGGLVGELMCLAGLDDAHHAELDKAVAGGLGESLFDADTVASAPTGRSPLGADDRAALAQAYAGQRADLRTLLATLKTKQLNVARFVRVACPARGTTLASGRLDRWLSVVGMLVPPGVAKDLNDFLLAVVKQRTDPRTLPGIEAMMPTSPLVRLLHWPTLRTRADLSVIAGDCNGSGLFGKLKQLATDWFYGGDHDLVVNTGSMSGGLQRGDRGARFRLDRDTAVNHFSYFANASSREWLARALLREDDADGGFLPIGQAPAEKPLSRGRLDEVMRRSRQGGSDRPIVVLVPGAMGSALTVRGEPVWLEPRALMLGGLKRIAIDASDVLAVEPLAAHYGPLIEFLAQTHEVHLLPYDWRQSVTQAAGQLAMKLQPLLTAAEQGRRPLRIVAHSMGGVVTRTMIADGGAGTAAWKRLTALPESRLLMLGTPNHGSLEAVRWLIGDNPVQSLLTLLNLQGGVNGVIDVVRRFPGLAEMLPFADASHRDVGRDFSDRRWWAAFKDQLKAGFPLAEAGTLGDARDTWTALAAAEPDAAHMVYVAGQDRATVVDYEVVDDEFMQPLQQVRWIATPDGDGTVTWASGRLPGVACWRAPDTAHGDLCRNVHDPAVFAGYLELLQGGRTDRLPALPAAAARGSRAALAQATEDQGRRFVLPPTLPPDSLPTPDEMARIGFGGALLRGDLATAPAGVAQPLRLMVHNLNLKFVREPLLIGHYQASRLTGTEHVVDGLLGGTLRASLAAGLYPVRPGCHQVFVNRQRQGVLASEMPRPQAVVVAGLGEEGTLRVHELSRSVQQAVVAYAQHRRDTMGDGAAPFALAATLLGSGGSGMSPAAVAAAIAVGVQAANERLAEAASETDVDCPGVAELHLIELYMDRASEAWQGLRLLAGAEPSRYTLHDVVEPGAGARRRPLDGPYRGAEYDFVEAVTVAEARPQDDAEALLGTELDHPAPVAPGGRIVPGTEPTTPRLQRADAMQTAIAYTLDTHRAGAPVRARTTQLRLVRALVQAASNESRPQRGIGRALFKLLVPFEMESYVGGDDDDTGGTGLVLQLDPGTAAIPWELLDGRDEDGIARQQRPWSVRTRLLRRLKTQVAPLKPHEAGQDDAILVIGEPLAIPGNYGPLPGARAEAEQVAALLSGPGGVEPTRVRSCIATDAHAPDNLEVIAALFERDYRVVHIAGHGEPGPEGGVVLSQKTFLGPAEIAAMRRLPELVFLNCCHLAHEGGVLQPRRYDRAAFASGIARALIERGVRCVIAAGWAVEDEPAAQFATRFYERLLAGERFMDAVGAAREAAWRAAPQGTTWAAYQCYGDPDWTWKPGAGAASGPRQSVADEFVHIISAPALALHLEMLIGNVQVDGDAAHASLQTAERLRERFGDRWGRIGAVAEAFGLVYAACRAYARAEEWLDRAVQASDGSASLKAAEQLANVRVRQAMTLPDDQARQVIAAVVVRLGELTRPYPTGERYSLLGSACKRLAMIEARTPAEARRIPAERGALAEAGRHYAEAETLLRREGGAVHYAQLNRLTISARLAQLAGGPRRLDQPLAEAVRQRLQQRLDTQPDFWSVAGMIELDLLQAWAASRLVEDLPLLAHRFDDLNMRWRSPHDWASVHEQARFLLAHLPAAGQPPGEAAAVAGLLSQLEAYAARPGPAATP